MTQAATDLQQRMLRWLLGKGSPSPSFWCRCPGAHQKNLAALVANPIIQYELQLNRTAWIRL